MPSRFKEQQRGQCGLESLFFWWVGGWRAFSVLWENLPEKPCNHQKFARGGPMVELQTQGAERGDVITKS